MFLIIAILIRKKEKRILYLGKFVFRKVRRMALDPGVSNFFSVVIEGVKKGFLIDGKI
jgi:hypothetical protein